MTTPDPYANIPRTNKNAPPSQSFESFTPTGERDLYGYDPNRVTSNAETDDIDAVVDTAGTHYDPVAHRSDRLRDELARDPDANARAKQSASSGDLFTLDGTTAGVRNAYRDSEQASRNFLSHTPLSNTERDKALAQVADVDLSKSAVDATFADVGVSHAGAIGATYAGSDPYTIGGLTDDAKFDPSIIAREADVNRHCLYVGVAGSQAASATGKPYTFSATSAALQRAVEAMLDMREGIFAATDGASSNVVQDLKQAQTALTDALEYFTSGAGIQAIAPVLESVAQPANTAVMTINTEGVGYRREYELAKPIIKKLHDAGENPAGIPGIAPNAAVGEIVTSALEAGIDAGAQMDTVLADAEAVAEKVVGVLDDGQAFSADIADVKTEVSSGGTSPQAAPAAAPRPIVTAPAGGGGGYVAGPAFTPGQVGVNRAGGDGSVAAARPGRRHRGVGGSSQLPGTPGPGINPGSSGVALPAQGTFTSGFGPRWGSAHNGVDIANEIGTPIYAVMDGTVINAGPASGFGNWVRIQHGDGSISVYGHMQAGMIYVTEGQPVRCGDNIAGIGSEGQSTGPHLHFEIHTSGGPIDPVPWFAQYGISL